MDKSHYSNLLFSTALLALISMSLISVLFLVQDESIYQLSQTDKVDIVINKINSDELTPTKEQMVTLLEIGKDLGASVTVILLNIKKAVTSIGFLLGIVVLIQINTLVKCRAHSKKPNN